MRIYIKQIVCIFCYKIQFCSLIDNYKQLYSLCNVNIVNIYKIITVIELQINANPHRIFSVFKINLNDRIFFWFGKHLFIGGYMTTLNDKLRLNPFCYRPKTSVIKTKPQASQISLKFPCLWKMENRLTRAYKTPSRTSNFQHTSFCSFLYESSAQIEASRPPH